MTTGPEMLMKAFGVDPKAITENIKQFGEVIIALKMQMDKIESNQHAAAIAEVKAAVQTEKILQLLLELSTDFDNRIPEKKPVNRAKSA